MYNRQAGKSLSGNVDSVHPVGRLLLVCVGWLQRSPLSCGGGGNLSGRLLSLAAPKGLHRIFACVGGEGS